MKIFVTDFRRVEHELEDDKVDRLAQYRESLLPADRNRVYMQDIESALYYIFKKEAASKAQVETSLKYRGHFD